MIENHVSPASVPNLALARVEAATARGLSPATVDRFWERLPDVSGELFLTFALDPKNYADEETAFEESLDWRPKLLFQLRQGVEYQGQLFR